MFLILFLIKRGFTTYTTFLSRAELASYWGDTAAHFSSSLNLLNINHGSDLACTAVYNRKEEIKKLQTRKNLIRAKKQ